MILTVQNISKTFVDQEIIHDASFIIEAHEKAALVGVNGAGKSTMLKIITGELAPDSGQVIFSKGITPGYLAQQQMLSSHSTILEELREAKKDIFLAEKQLRDLEQQMKHMSGESLTACMQQYNRLSEWYERNDGYAAESEIFGVLKGLGFTVQDASRQTDTLSGGQKTRVALGKLLLSSPELILLDEPTNHLDIRSIEWLEGDLKGYKGAVLIVSPDRYFLDRIVSKVIEIEHAHVNSYIGDYTAFSRQKQQMRQAQLKAYLKQQDEIKHQEQVIEKLRSFNREKSIKRAESREKMLDKIERVEKPASLNDRIRLTLTPDIKSGKDVLTVSDLSKSFPPLELFSGISFQIKRGERVALIGDNGTGKTTMLRILNGLESADDGTFTYGTNVRIGYFDQDHQVLHPEKTLFDEISDTWPDMKETQIRNVLAAFLFTGDDVYKRISELSGGEQGRVSLAKLMLSGANFLILDEPTNHLDIQSKEILEDALCLYSGTVLFVSHDRYFVNRSCTRIMDLKNHSLTNYLGNYDYYLEKNAQQSEAEASPQRLSDKAFEKAAPALSGSRQAWEKSREEERNARKMKSRLKKTEEEIAQCEEEDAKIDALLESEETFSDPAALTELTNKKALLAERLEKLYETWESLAEEVGDT